MNDHSYEAAKKLISSATYVQQGRDARKSHEKQIQILLEQRKLPEEGWSDDRIELLLQELALMDSNNYPGNVGLGEREARVASDLVAKRHYRFGHGIGRSGDIAEVQPKAAGSSILMKLTNQMTLDLLRRRGVRSTAACIVLPMATGMAIVMTLLSLRQQRPEARYVLWPRIDQKSCFKSVVTAGFDPVVVENALKGDELQTNLADLEAKIEELSPENIACVLTTTSCFAPRVFDNLPEVAKMCAHHNVPHIVNNAYGVQSSKCLHLIEEAKRVGRLDVFVQSTDKNFMVPVGGAVVAAFDDKTIADISKTYPGRASASPTLDLFITLLSLGWEGYQRLCLQRKENYVYLKEELCKVASEFGERVLETPHNDISIGVTLTAPAAAAVETDWQEFGSMLFIRSVSGVRVVQPGNKKTIGPTTFLNWGSHSNAYPHTYFTAAAALGMEKKEVDEFVHRLKKVFKKFSKRSDKMAAEEK